MKKKNCLTNRADLDAYIKSVAATVSFSEALGAVYCLACICTAIYINQITLWINSGSNNFNLAKKLLSA
jgi:hypothetical protein